ncbi:hypothetical protein GALMADRAFT_253009 [Galerina marginata CBS 339.88]|uniref:Nephrocystin 3-like N-terminal domain-containing protein n=1 Tax=Galerina marginata (strain CBS 339.88) TaxID=685588 RepID=A0A067SQ46_GALM3|nr:hypothetical protein GALMADRAFT_253009 [Galerina marginata CBS 339.88]
MFKNSRNFSIHGGNFAVFTGKDIWDNHIAPGAFHNSRERLEYDPPKCHPKTRVAVIQAIIDWIEDGQRTTFIKWLNGAAGVGKSAIAQEIAELCHKSGRLAASFFWSRSAAGRNDEERLIASLAYQLLTVIPQLRGPVEAVVGLDPYIFTRSLQTQMESLIIQPLKEVFEHNQQDQVNNPRIIVLDGLDECGKPEAQQYILRLVADSISKFPIPLCFLIASRPEKAIRDSFNDQPLLTITDRLILDEKYCPDDDIKLFLVESFESVKRTHELRVLLPAIWPFNNDIDKLVRRSSGQFIFAATVVKFVKSSRQRPNKQLDIILGITTAGSVNPFAELDALYHRIFSLVVKEDLPKALEIISIAMFLRQSSRLTARQIERILSYPHGELQSILIDLHSVLHVPVLKSEDEETDKPDEETGVEGEETDDEGEETDDEGEETDDEGEETDEEGEEGDEEGDETDEEGEKTDKEGLRILHASLRDFLLSPSRSKEFYVDQGLAHEGIARHFLRYIREYSDDIEDHSCDYVIFLRLEYVIRDASPTAELLLECFDFDPVKWASRLIKGLRNYYWWSDHVIYNNVVGLCDWFQTQEANVLEHLGPTRSFDVQHSRSWEVALNLTCGRVFHVLYEEHPRECEDVATVITHPEILVVRDPYLQLERIFRVRLPMLLSASNLRSGKFSGSRWIVLIQNYLCDQERAGRYFVDGGRYASLCIRLLKIVLAFQRSSEDENGKQKENDRNETSDNMDRHHMPKPDDEEALKFAISTLPFHLSNADYNSKLAELCRSMLNLKVEEKLPELCEDIQLLKEAINLYLEKEPVTPNEAQLNEAQRFRADKRRRESNDDPEVTGKSALSTLTLKRAKIMDALSPADASEPEDAMCL